MVRTCFCLRMGMENHECVIRYLSVIWHSLTMGINYIK
nr:MAG TPA: hypothetical protein [Caudoviricetes sp.]